MGLFAHSTPIFLAIGNHEEEEACNLDCAADNIFKNKHFMGVNAKKQFLPNPMPDVLRMRLNKLMTVNKGNLYGFI